MKIAIIIGSTRPGRVGKKVAKWYLEQVSAIKAAEFEIVDINDQNLPLLDEPIPPAAGKYQNDHTKKWSEVISSYDAYVWVTAEYNHGVPGALKNAIDYLYNEWVKKPVAIVSYGSAGGVRAAEHLRQIAGELQMADIRPTIMIRQPWDMVDENDAIKPELISGDPKAQAEDLIWWASALKNAKL